ncbi:Formin-like protein 6 AltName: Full=OsFH6 [Rhizoctonia solani AG-1 IB]|uniref:Rhizoctonia solani AG1-IB WGS project CAOJ00000000 data, isolate 7/3/14, contig 13043 n=1 Tax=Thanatephorus cucumeris (strain AG1-IB / isolate 7/3/14) TaxID=1108050 RepID=M5BW43_THACB|nr:Formin-like protein 6 AltName: Full=OsFH6 [Rhizoctonia solani AG-1 IB]
MLDITRANNVAIMLKTLKASPVAIREAILAVDDVRLSAEDLIMISKQLPTAEEASRIQDFGDVGKLAEADRYFSEILKIPRLQERLSCMIYRRRLELDIIEAQPDLSILHDAAIELCTSDKLLSIQTVMSGVNSIESGLKKTTSEVISCRKASNAPSDKFGSVMQPFIRSSAESVYSLKSLAESTQVKLTEMVSYFGETTEGSEPTKPEDVFEMVLAFSSSLQRAALDVNATMVRIPPPVVVSASEESTSTPKQEKHELLSPSDAAPEGSISSVHLSAGRGDLDQAIRSLRNGRRRARQDRPLSKIFLDGGSNRRSRLFES